jgi:hypothetical protein
VAPLHKWGGVRIGAASRGKWSVLWCPLCRWLRWMSIERFSLKALPPQKPPAPVADFRPTVPQSGGLALALLIVFLVVAIPLTLLFVAGMGYFLMGSKPRPVNLGDVAYPPQATGGLIYQNPDSRFEVSINQVTTPEGEHIVSAPLGPGLRHNQFLRVPPGEYRAEVKAGDIVVREDTFTVNAGGTPTTYSVGAGGTLRFVARPEDRNLVLVLNHVTGQTIWDWPRRQYFVLPEGLVHVDLRRPDGNGDYPILTSNYFDIVAGQETVIRVREKDVELVSSGDDDAVITLHREGLKAVEARYAAGREPPQAVIDADLRLHRARLEWAECGGRIAEALSIRKEMVALAKGKVNAVESAYKSGRVTVEAVNEAKLELLKEQERLAEAEAKVKVGKEPGDSTTPPSTGEKIMRNSLASTTQTA